ncbi:MAG TPA: adenylate/guanylate cyclase domain-containing protein [Candidatus Limnocylindrales bacterium]
MSEERKLVSLLFADVVDSTAMGARHDAELVRTVMARYFARMKDVAETHGGTVEKFIGDAVMVVFGVPQLHEDDAERAVRAALAMRDAVADLDHDSSVALALRVGVNSGEVVAGVGDDRQFLVTGDAVNVAARLQQGAEAGEVVVGALTARLTRDAIEYEPREPIVAKGKVEPLIAFRALGAYSARPAAHGGAHALDAAFVGRTRELRQLLEAFERAQDERTGYLVTIVGNAGVGKSRLVGEGVARIAQRSDVRILRGRCLPYGAGITYWPLMDVIREDAGIGPTDDRATALAKLGDRLGALVPQSDRLSAIQARVAVLLGLEVPDAALPNVPAERIAVELSWGIRQHLEAIAARGPLVVVIDDLQWADPAALDVLGQMADPSSAVPFLLVCIARPELLERYPSWSVGRANATLIVLEPLDATDTQTLVTRLLGIEDVGSLAGSAVVERSAGNPLFCEEFVRMLVETRHPDAAGQWSATRPAADLPLPETIASIVAARMDGLPLVQKTCLQRASVIGEQFSLDELLTLGGELGAAPEALLRKGFFLADRGDPSGRSLRFKHLLIRDVAYGSLTKAERATLHDRVGAALEAQMSDRHDEFSELLAYHAAQSYLLSRDLDLEGDEVAARAERVLRWSGLAGDRALAFYATEQAAGHYALAIEVGLRERIDTALLEHLYVNRGRALELRGAYDEAIETYEAFERLAVERGDDRFRADALAHQATIYRTATTRFDAERADTLLGAALKIARTLGDRVLIAQLQRDQIHIHLFRGHVQQAIEVGEESLAAATASDSREQLMYTCNDIVCAYREAGLFEKGRDAAIRATALAEEIDNKPIAANSRSTRATLEFTAGDYDTALRLYGEAGGIAEGIANYWGRSMSMGASAWPRFERGDFGQAIQAWEESLRLAEAVGFLMPAAIHQSDLAWCYRAAGADEEAERHLAAAHALVESRFPYLRAWTLGHLSRAATARGALDLAGRYLERAQEGLAAKGEFFAFQHAHVGLAAVELKLGRRDYEGAVAEARARGDEQRALMRPYVADLEYLEGEAHRLRGELDAATDALARARASASALGGRRILWQILASLASVEDARGHAVSAARTRQEARSIAAGIEDSLRPVGLAERFRAQAAVRELMGAEGRPV